MDRLWKGRCLHHHEDRALGHRCWRAIGSGGRGNVINFRGEAWKAESSDLVFSNGKVHERILELVRGM